MFRFRACGGVYNAGMAVYAVSDLHVWGEEDPLYRSLLALVRAPRAGDVLVLAGDVFDLFIGDKEVFRGRYREFLAALREAGERGVRVHYVEGNHDFLLARALAGLPSVEVHASECAFEHHGKRFYVGHGDLVDRRDYGYRALRGFLRSPFIRAFVRVAPGGWVDWIGRTGSERSRGGARERPAPAYSGERLARLRALFRSYAEERLREGHDFVILGHCHDLDEREASIGGRACHYANVGFPREHGVFLRWEPGRPRLEREKLP
jgi:UDP-2,3-diacylglucosamine hydrolase